MKTLKTILVLVCLLASTVMTGCCTCQMTCSRNGASTTCTSAVTHADYQSCQHE